MINNKNVLKIEEEKENVCVCVFDIIVNNQVAQG